jgi:hypothetical protein
MRLWVTARRSISFFLPVGERARQAEPQFRLIMELTVSIFQADYYPSDTF